MKRDREEKSEFRVHGKWSEELRFKFDLFAPPMSHLHVPLEPRVGNAGRQAGCCVLVFMCVCAEDTRVHE